jgi:DNA-binding LacI/PurR family transcriptional regulator
MMLLLSFPSRAFGRSPLRVSDVGRRSTIYDVARAAGVSTTTVSRVLNGRPDVAEATRARVQRVVAELGYARASSSRRGPAEAAHYVTIIAHFLDNEYIGAIVRGILDQLDPSSYQTVVHLTAEQRAREAEYVRIARSTGSDGLLMVTPCLREAELADLAGHDTPFVMIDAYPDSSEALCVRATNWQGMRDGVSYLIELGHRRIGLILGQRGDRITEAREHGYRSALSEAGLPFEPSLVVDGSYNAPSGFRAALALLALEPRPTAIVASNDLMALGTMEAARVRDLAVPHDLSVMGYDDLPLAAHTHPPLTTIHQPLYDMGRMAAQMLVDLAAKRDPVSRQVELPTRLIVRGSCAVPPVEMARPGARATDREGESGFPEEGFPEEGFPTERRREAS